MSIAIDLYRCRGCGSCVTVCPEGALSLVNERAFWDRVKCSDCGICVEACDKGAIEWAQAPPVIIPVPVSRRMDEKRINLPGLPSSGQPPVKTSAGEWLGLLGRLMVSVATDILEKAGSSRTLRKAGGRCHKTGTLRRMRRRGR